MSLPLLARERVALRDGAVLFAPGAVLLGDTGVLVVADTHAGYTASARARGVALPDAGEDAVLCARLRSLWRRSGATHLVVAGDAGHGVGAERDAGRGRSPLDELVEVVGARRLTVVAGNHDEGLLGAWLERGVELCASWSRGPWRVHHGDDAQELRALREEALSAGGRVVLGHLHPALALEEGPGARGVVPAFVTAAGLLCLPALSPLSRGLDVRREPLRRTLEALAEPGPLGVAVALGERVLPIGDVFSPVGRARGGVRG